MRSLDDLKEYCIDRPAGRQFFYLCEEVKAAWAGHPSQKRIDEAYAYLMDSEHDRGVNLTRLQDWLFGEKVALDSVFPDNPPKKPPVFRVFADTINKCFPDRIETTSIRYPIPTKYDTLLSEVCREHAIVMASLASDEGEALKKAERELLDYITEWAGAGRDEAERYRTTLLAVLKELGSEYSMPSMFDNKTLIRHEVGLVVEAAQVFEAKENKASVLQWAVGRWNDEVGLRPMQNIHRRTLDDTWRQVIKQAGGNPDELVGLSHDALL